MKHQYCIAWKKTIAHGPRNPVEIKNFFWFPTHMQAWNDSKWFKTRAKVKQAREENGQGERKSTRDWRVGCPKKTKNIFFVMQLNPLIFIG